ncbi:MAG: Lpg1974 family pore-forming outer membrane protein [Parachlamydiales bacterium]
MMNEKFYKLYPLALTSLIAMTQLSADDAQRLEQLKNKIDAISVKNDENEIGGKNTAYPARPQNHRNAFFLTADFLYWRADLDGIPIAVKGNNASLGYQNKMKIIDMDFDWNPAFRVGLGGILGGDSWDLKAEYTRYTNHSERSAHVSGDNALIPLWATVTNKQSGIFVLNGVASHATGHYHLNYNVVDLELGRNYFVSRAISVRPFIGARGAFIYQHTRYHYTGLTFAEGANYSPLTTKGKSNYQGGGIRAGFNAGWHFNRYWSFFSEISGSLLYGRFDTAENMTTKNNSMTSHLSGDFNAARPNIEIILGLQWETYFCKDRCRFSLGLGYEFVEWFLMNQFPREFAPGYLNGASGRFHGDLGLQGGTLKGRFEF